MVPPKIVFGTMTFGTGEGGRIDDLNEMKEILDSFHAAGYNELDTARMYCEGDTENKLRQLNYADKFTLATKAFPFEPGMHSPDLLKKQFQQSLDALGAQSVDIFYLHAPDKATPFEVTLKAVNELFKAGKFKEFGLSNYAAWEVMEIWQICDRNSYVRPTVYQGRYNAISRDVEMELFKCLKKLNIRFYAYNPLAGGLLAGKFNFDSLPSEGRYRPDSKQGQKYRERFWLPEYFQVLEMYKNACAKENVSPVEAALRWIYNHSKLDGECGDAIIIGASSLQQFEQNMKALKGGPLSSDLLATIDKCWKVVMPIANPYAR